MTPLLLACGNGLREVVELLLADERVDVNQASRVRVGGEGEGGWRERAGLGGGCGAVVRVTTEGGRTSHQQGGECKGSRAVHTNIGARGFMGTEAVSREDGGAGGGGRVEVRSGVVLGW